MVRRRALRRSGLLCVALIGTLPLWVASCEDAPRKDCVRLRELLEDVSAGVSAWRCPAGIEGATAISKGNDENSCAALVEGPCIGAFPKEGKFACGPKDCSVGTACRSSTECDKSKNFSCVTYNEPCSPEDCACGIDVCGSTYFFDCAKGVGGDLWLRCSAYLACGS